MGAGLTGPHAGKWPLKFDELLSSGTLALSSCRGQQRIARHRFGRNPFAASLPARPRAPFPWLSLVLPSQGPQSRAMAYPKTFSGMQRAEVR